LKFPGRELHKRLVFSYFAEFGDPLKDPEVSSYSDFLLLRIAQEAGSRKQEAGRMRKTQIFRLIHPGNLVLSP
jgi:hypothetical protein